MPQNLQKRRGPGEPALPLRRHLPGSGETFPEHTVIEERYRAENAVLTAIGHGNETQAMESVKKLVNLGIPPRLADTLRDRKDLTITLNSLMRKAAEQAGCIQST